MRTIMQVGYGTCILLPNKPGLVAAAAEVLSGAIIVEHRYNKHPEYVKDKTGGIQLLFVEDSEVSEELPSP